jgi:hypothetical protein
MPDSIGMRYELSTPPSPMIEKPMNVRDRRDRREDHRVIHVEILDGVRLCVDHLPLLLRLQDHFFRAIHEIHREPLVVGDRESIGGVARNCSMLYGPLEDDEVIADGSARGSAM